MIRSIVPATDLAVPETAAAPAPKRPIREEFLDRLVGEHYEFLHEAVQRIHEGLRATVWTQHGEVPDTRVRLAASKLLVELADAGARRTIDISGQLRIEQLAVIAAQVQSMPTDQLLNVVRASEPTNGERLG